MSDVHRFKELRVFFPFRFGGERFEKQGDTTAKGSDALTAYQRDQREVLAAGCIIVAAAKPESLSALPAVERAWFDWLIGAPLARTIRASSLGAAARRHRRGSRRG